MAKKTKTVEVTCTGCGRVVRVSKNSECAKAQLCYECIKNERKNDYVQRNQA